MQATISLACLLLLAYVVQALAQYLLLHTVPRLRERMDVRWARVFWHDQVLRRLARVVPSRSIIVTFSHSSCAHRIEPFSP